MNKGYFTRCIQFSFLGLLLGFTTGCSDHKFPIILDDCIQDSALPKDVPLNEIISFTCGGGSSNFFFDLTDTLGIEQLTAVEDLNLIGSFPSIDLSQNTQLISLSLNSPNLLSLDVSQNTALESLSLFGPSKGRHAPPPPSISSLDLSNNTALKDVAIYKQWKLENISLPQTTTLQSFLCDDCDLTNIDFSQNIGLATIKILYSPRLREVNLPQTTTLKEFSCGSCDLGNVDLSQNTELTRVAMGGTQINDISSMLGLMNLQFVSLKLTQNIPCAQLDALEAIVSEQFTRPDTCVQ